MKLFNLHTHTRFCDGTDEPEAYVISALNQGFSSLGFSGHAPMPFENKYAIKAGLLPEYIQQIETLREKYKGRIQILKSLEFDFIPGISTDFKSITEKYKLDYTIGSVHMVRCAKNEKLWFIDGAAHEIYDRGLEEIFNGNIQQAVKSYFAQLNQMIDSQEPDIIGHMDKIKMHNKNRFFVEDEPWYISEIDKTLDLIKSKKCIVEVNTRGMYKKRSDSLFPGMAVLKKIKKLGIPVTVSSDAHKPGELALLIPETLNLLSGLGFKSVMNFEKTFVEVPLDLFKRV